MIINKRTNFIIAEPKDALSKPKHMFENFDGAEWYFMMPKEIKNDQMKIIYKIGFLKRLYINLKPELSFLQIYSIINTEWQVFIGARQMERNWKKYVDLFMKKEED